MTRRGPWQPPLGDGPARLMSLKVAPELYDQVKAAAVRAELSVSKWARAAFQRLLTARPRQNRG